MVSVFECTSHLIGPKTNEKKKLDFTDNVRVYYIANVSDLLKKKKLCF